MLKEYQVNFYPIKAIVEAENEEEAEKEAITRLYNGEMEYEVEEIVKIEK